MRSVGRGRRWSTTAFNSWTSPAGQIGNDAFPPGEAIRGPSRSSTALDPSQTAQTDPYEPFPATAAEGRLDYEAVIRARLLVMLTTGSRQLVEQRLRLFQIGGIEPFGKPAVDRSEDVTISFARGTGGSNPPSSSK